MPSPGSQHGASDDVVEVGDDVVVSEWTALEPLALIQTLALEPARLLRDRDVPRVEEANGALDIADDEHVAVGDLARRGRLVEHTRLERPDRAEHGVAVAELEDGIEDRAALHQVERALELDVLGLEPEVLAG